MSVVAVTGATGLVGAHVVSHLVEKGYIVRAATRNDDPKAPKNAPLVRHGSKVVLVKVVDVTEDVDGMKTLMKGARFLIHVAAPIFQKELSREQYILLGTKGVLTALRAAKEEGVEHVVLTASMASVCGTQREKDPTHVWTEADVNDNPSSSYSAGKTAAEQAAWSFVKEHDGITLSTIHPAMCIGPLVPGQQVGSTMNSLFHAINGVSKKEGGLPFGAFGVCDLRDVAKAHVAAMERPEARGERYLVTSCDQYTLKELAELIVKLEPRMAATTALEWKDRSKDTFIAQKPSSDNGKVRSLLGGLIPLDKTLLDIVSDLAPVSK